MKLQGIARNILYRPLGPVGKAKAGLRGLNSRRALTQITCFVDHFNKQECLFFARNILYIRQPERCPPEMQLREQLALESLG